MKHTTKAGMPEGRILYPETMDAIRTGLNRDPQTISQIHEKVADEGFSVSHDTVKKYLDLLVSNKKAVCKRIGKFGQIITYCLPDK